MKTNRMLDPRNAALLDKHGEALLSERYRAVLHLRRCGWTFSAIGEKYNYTRQRIQQIERRALAKLERAEVME